VWLLNFGRMFPGMTTNCFTADLWRYFASEDNIDNLKLFIRGCVTWYYADIKIC
jgi:hypothetical protein